MRFLPPPITELTFEQRFEMSKLLRQIVEADKDTLIECCEELLRHNFILRSNLANLTRNWNTSGFDSPGTDADQEPSDFLQGLQDL